MGGDEFEIRKADGTTPTGEELVGAKYLEAWRAPSQNGATP